MATQNNQTRSFAVNAAMSAYFEAWKFKHPQPEDMRKVLESSCGKDLSWLFDDLIQTTNHIDFKLKNVVLGKQGAVVRVKNVGQVNGPIEVNVYAKDQLVETHWLEPGQTSVTVKTPYNEIQKVIIDHDKILATIEVKRKTPKKKSNWQEKYEQMMDAQKKVQALKDKTKK
jgi:hypothetical protein